MAIEMAKQVGPLQVGAWIAVVGGGLAIAFYSQRNNGNSGPSIVEANDTSGYPGVGVGGTPSGYVPTDLAAANTEGAITSNEVWAARATRILIASNYDPILADSAVRKYITGNQLSITEQMLISIALAALGPLPTPLPPGPDPLSPPKSVPDVVVPPPPPPAQTPVEKPVPMSNYQPYAITGGFNASDGQYVQTHTVQPGEMAQLTRGADGLIHNQWGNTVGNAIDQYGSPVWR